MIKSPFAYRGLRIGSPLLKLKKKKSGSKRSRKSATSPFRFARRNTSRSAGSKKRKSPFFKL